jgi:hypothetical protein
MPGLIDIVPGAETVEMRGHSIAVRGLSIEAIGSLFIRFPELNAMLAANSWDVARVLKFSDAAIAAIIAACAPDHLDEERASALALGEKAALLAPILRLTAPGGFGPFVELMTAAGLTAAAVVDKAPVIRSRKPSKP